jgi:hypothetical protein
VISELICEICERAKRACAICVICWNTDELAQARDVTPEECRDVPRDPTSVPRHAVATRYAL